MARIKTKQVQGVGRITLEYAIEQFMRHNRLKNTDLDALSDFGMDVRKDERGKSYVWLNKVDDWHFKISVPVAVSPQFFAWVFGLGNYVTITGPEHVKQEMKEMLEEIHKRY